MTEPIRVPHKVIAALAAACEAFPDQRVTQVIVNACGTDPFYLEDEEAVEKLRNYAKTANA